MDVVIRLLKNAATSPFVSRDPAPIFYVKNHGTWVCLCEYVGRQHLLHITMNDVSLVHHHPLLHRKTNLIISTKLEGKIILYTISISDIHFVTLDNCAHETSIENDLRVIRVHPVRPITTCHVADIIAFSV